MVGLVFPQKVTPTLVKTAVTAMVVYTETDNTPGNPKYKVFVGGADEPDVVAAMYVSFPLS